MIRLILADDQPMLLKALAAILDTEPDIQVVGTAADGAEAVELARTGPVEVVAMDIRMPRLDGIAAARMIRQETTAKVLMLTTFNSDQLVRSAIEAGAHGFLLKDADPDVLAAAVRTVARGESVLDSAVTGHVLHAYREAISGRAELAPEVRQGLSLLTRREREVLELIARGATNSEIATKLVVAPTTVKTHVASLLRKLHARDRVALVLTAQQAGLA